MAVLSVIVLLATAAMPFTIAGSGAASGADPLSAPSSSPLAAGPASLLASTFFGSGGEVAVTGTATAEDGTVYAVGYVTAGTLPTTPGAYDRNRAFIDGFVAHFSADLSTLIASTYLGGSDDDYCTAVALGDNGLVYATGYTSGSDFPTTDGAYSDQYAGGYDVFVSALSPDLATLTASTYLGGSSEDRPAAVAVTADRVIVAGSTYSGDFPTSASAYDTSYNGDSDGFVSVFDLGLASLHNSTFIGSSAYDSVNDLAVFNDNIYFAGITGGSYPTTPGAYDRNRAAFDAFVTAMPLDLVSLIASTYLGGSSDESGNALAVDPTGVYVAGSTSSDDFPTSEGAYGTSLVGDTDMFVSKLSLGLSSLIASTYLGGDEYDNALGLLVSQRQAFVVGETYSSDFPTVDAYDASYNGNGDGAVAHLDASFSSLVYSTYLGGAKIDAASVVALSPAGGIVAAGYTRSSDFPATPGAFDTSFNGGANGQDGFLARFDIGGEAAHTQWSQWHGDVRHTGVYYGDLPDEKPRELWSADVPAAQYSSVAVGEGKVFVYSVDNISAVDIYTGETVWSEKCLNLWDQASYGSWASPVYADGLVFAPGDTARHASDGSPAWPLDKGLRMGVGGGPLVVRDKVVQADWVTGTYYCYNEYNGTELWNITLTSLNAQGVAAYHDGKLFLTAYGNLTCVDLNTGDVIWNVIPPGYIGPGSDLEFCGAAAVADGYVYVTTYNQTGDAALLCYDENTGDDPIWSSTIHLTYATPAVVDGKVYVSGGWEGFAGPQTVCFDAYTGEEIWNVTTVGDHLNSVSVADGKAFVGGQALDVNDNGTFLYDLGVVGDAAFHNGRIFIVTENTVHCFGEVTAAPIARFTADPVSGDAPLTVQFTDRSVNAPDEWAWDFGDGNTSTEQNPSHTYAAEGGYTVTLTVTNTIGSNTTVATNYIVVGPLAAPVAAFAADVTSGLAPLTVQFTDLSTGYPTSWSWNFGDGNTSNVQNPSHQYQTPGTYTVSLTVTRGPENDTAIKTGYIVVSEPPEPVSEDWTKFQGDLYNRGVTNNTGPTTNLTLEWVVNVSTAMAGIDHQPIIADGKVFVIDVKGFVWAFNMDGTLAWANKALGTGVGGLGFQLSTPAYHDGMLYVAIINGSSTGVSVHALYADNGTALWSKYDITGSSSSQPNTPIVYDNGRIYFGTYSGTGKYFCLNAGDGTTAWQENAITPGTGFYWAGAAIIGEHIVYADDGGYIVSRDKTTGALIEAKSINDIFGLPNVAIRSAITYDPVTERIFFTDRTGLKCLSVGFGLDTGVFDTGRAWNTTIGYSTSTPAIYDGKLYVGVGQFSGSNVLRCLDAENGTILWNSTSVNGGIQSSPVVSVRDNGEAYIYFTTNTLAGSVYCVSAQTHQVTGSYTPDPPYREYVLQGVTIYDGKVFYGNDNGYLFCIGGDL